MLSMFLYVFVYLSSYIRFCSRVSSAPGQGHLDGACNIRSQLSRRDDASRV